MGELKSRLKENFASTWKLLSDTNHFLSRTPIFVQYESLFRKWRLQLQTHKNNSEVLQDVRKEIVSLRKNLRLQGYNLMLGQYQIKVEGFRSDNAMALGFQRAVLTCIDRQVFLMSGQDNHNELKSRLGQRLIEKRLRQKEDLHSLWYLWDNRLLLLSGADSEPPEHFEHFRGEVEADPYFYIAAFLKV
jgi:hypothetical protein